MISRPLPCKPPLPLPLGEVAERSEDGEGIQGCNALSVTFGDSSPRGRAKGVRILTQKMERICTDTLHSLFYDHMVNLCGALLFFVQRLGSLCQRCNGLRQFSGGGQRLVMGVSGRAYLDQQPAGGQVLVKPLAAQL